MKVVVTGASGYLGGNLCHVLLNQGHSVRALVRPSSNLDSLPSPTAVDVCYGDVTDYTSLIAAFSGCHVIFHVAALVEPWLPDPSRFFSVNVVGLENVLRAARETETVEKIVYTSSFFALGSTDGGDLADETRVHNEKLFCTEYERSKAMADKIAMRAAAEGVPIVVVYPGVIYGPGKVTAGNIIARMIIERFNGRLPGYIGNGDDRYSFSYVDDVVEGHIAAMHKGRNGERYLLTGENASFKHVFDVAAILTGTSRPWFHIPLWVLEAYGWISVFFARITGKLPLISPPASECKDAMQERKYTDAKYKTVKVLRHQWAYSCEKAKVELGYSPRSLKDGMSEVLPWLKSLGLIKY
ncbi:hypothetical protein Syun_015355 [Stephania yunnanensis]|uniref:NAD-dependent epimerase/dehydratase domain-containing protein n=1 Tax=Stephania yunnanensis TaxID=152371 RepID=A0AAP0JLW0_9MAGN